MWRKRAVLVLILIITVGALIGCSNLAQKWGTLTSDQKARVVLADLQSQLTNLFDTGEKYVLAHPEKRTLWIEKVVPAFKVANDALKVSINLAKQGNITPSKVYAEIQPLIDSVQNLLVALGAIDKASAAPSRLPPISAAMDPMVIMSLVILGLRVLYQMYVTIGRVVGFENIPTWEEITAPNALLDDRIKAWMDDGTISVGVKESPDEPAAGG